MQSIALHNHTHITLKLGTLMEILVITSILITITGTMYKLKVDYGSYYDRRLSLIFLICIWFIFSFCVGVIFGANYLPTITGGSLEHTLYTTFQNVTVASFIAIVPWVIIYSLPVKE